MVDIAFFTFSRWIGGADVLQYASNHSYFFSTFSQVAFDFIPASASFVANCSIEACVLLALSFQVIVKQLGDVIIRASAH